MVEAYYKLEKQSNVDGKLIISLLFFLKMDGFSIKIKTFSYNPGDPQHIV